MSAGPSMPDLAGGAAQAVGALPGAYHEKAYLLRAIAWLADEGGADARAFAARVGRARHEGLAAAAAPGGALATAGVIAFDGDTVRPAEPGRALVAALREGAFGLRGGEVARLGEAARAGWDTSLDGPEPMDPTTFDWFPPPERWRDCNLRRVEARFGARSHAELRAISIRDRERFMRGMCEHLGLAFEREPARMVDAARGAAFARFFSGGFLSAVRSCIDRHLPARRDRDAIRYEREDGAVRRWTFAELSEQVRRTARVLREAGLGPGDVVALQMPNTPEAAAGFFACMLNRHAVAPLYEVAGTRDVAERLAAAGCRAVLAADVGRFAGADRPIAPATAEAIARARKDLGHVVERLIVWNYASEGPPPGEPAAAFTDWRDAAERGGVPDLPVEAGDAVEPGIIGFSSGSTGTPKGLVLTQSACSYNFVKEAHLYGDVRPDDVAFWLTRPAWVMWYWTLIGGLGNGAAFLAYEGSPAVARPDAPGADGNARVLDLAARHGVTLLGTIASSCTQLAGVAPAEIDRYHLSRVRTIGSTAEPITAAGWDAIAFAVGRGRVHPMSFIGGTDRGALNNSPAPDTAQHAMSVGGWVVECDGLLVDEEGRPTDGAEGEVAVRGPYPGQAQGMIGDPDGRQFCARLFRPRRWREAHGPDDLDLASIRPEENDVWFHGDGYRRQNARGEPRYQALGRVGTDRFKCGGIWVEPVLVEGAAEALPEVADSMALQAPGGPKGWVLLVQPARPPLSDRDLAAIRDAVLSVTSKTTLPDAILEVPAVPRNIARKKMHAVMRRLAQGAAADSLEVGGMAHGDRWIVPDIARILREHHSRRG